MSLLMEVSKTGKNGVQVKEAYGEKVETIDLRNGRVREIHRGSVQMHPRDIPIAKTVLEKYKDKGGWDNPLAVKEYFRKANAWRKRAGNRYQKVEKEQEQQAQQEEPLARRFMIATCYLARGRFEELQDYLLFDVSLLADLQCLAPQERFGKFKECIEGLNKPNG